jgi:lysyl-tRNA synthetase class 2
MTGCTLAERRPRLEARALVLQQIRQFFTSGGYLEVDTPLLIPAPAPELHIDAIPCGDRFLQTSPELCMKRLLAAGYDRIFQISHCWRAGERGSLHHPEFTMLEWYRSHADYTDLMSECEALLLHITVPSGSNSDTPRLAIPGIDLTPPWPRLTLEEAFQHYADTPLGDAMTQDRYEEILVEQVEPHLGIERPCFLTDFPASMAALARLKPGTPEVAERFELYIGGIELANAFSELTDQDEQRARFIAERDERAARGLTAYPLPLPFLDALPHMPPAAGIAVGLDRLVMLLTGSHSIDDVVPFTQEEL